MAFKEITILEVDHAHIKEHSENEVMVPYILSNTPPDEWKSYIEKKAPAKANIKIIGKIACYKCQKDVAAIRQYGACWNEVADLVEDANRYFLGMELRRYQERGRQAEREHREEPAPREYAIEWDRYMSRD